MRERGPPMAAHLVHASAREIMIVQRIRHAGVPVAGGVVDCHGELHLQPTRQKVEEAVAPPRDIRKTCTHIAQSQL